MFFPQSHYISRRRRPAGRRLSPRLQGPPAASTTAPAHPGAGKRCIIPLTEQGGRILNHRTVFASNWLCAVAVAQSPTATVVGTVRDVLGAAIPGASVQIRNTENNDIRKIQTDAQGEFTKSEIGERWRAPARSPLSPGTRLGWSKRFRRGICGGCEPRGTVDRRCSRRFSRPGRSPSAIDIVRPRKRWDDVSGAGAFGWVPAFPALAVLSIDPDSSQAD